MSLPMRFPRVAALLQDAPELSSLAILDTALLVCEAALVAAHPELADGQVEGAHSTPASSATRARALIAQARKLSIALAAYRKTVTRDARALDEEQAVHAPR